MMKRLLAAGALCALALGCASEQATYRDLDRMGADYQREALGQPQNPDESTNQDSCGASRFAHLIGAEADAIDQAALPPRTRIITPDMMVTQDFSPQRLNIMVGTDGVVGSLRCF